jgi:hypothetical protein
MTYETLKVLEILKNYVSKTIKFTVEYIITTIGLYIPLVLIEGTKLRNVTRDHLINICKLNKIAKLFYSKEKSAAIFFDNEIVIGG